MIRAFLLALTFLTLLLIASVIYSPAQQSQPTSQYPSPLRELVDLSKHHPYDYKGIGPKLERAILAISELENCPERTKRMEMIIQAVLRNEVDRIWFERFFTFPTASDIELLDSKNEKVRQFAEAWFVRKLKLSNDRLEQLWNSWTRYFRRLRQEGKEEPRHVAALLFQKNPAFALQLFWSLSDEFAQLPQEQKNQHTQELEWLLHCVDVAYYRARYLNMLDREDINPVRAQMKWLLWNYPQWWAKLYVLEVFIRIPGLANDELVEEIRKEKHPYVVIRLPELEKKLRRTP
jgi:hypothetical protein